MARLLQGDVGSGKTVVAAAAVRVALANGLQAAVMAPTEILAEQHFKTFCRLLGPSRRRPWRARPRRGPGGPPAHRQPARRRQDPDAPGDRRRPGRRGHRHPRPHPGERGVRPAGPGGHRRAAPLRRDAAGGPAPEGLQPPRAGHDRHAHPAHPGPHHLRRPGRLGHRRDAAGPPGHQDLLAGPARARAGLHASSARRLARGARPSWSARWWRSPRCWRSRPPPRSTSACARQIFPDLRLGLLHGRMRPPEKDAVMRSFRDRELDVLVSTPVVEVGIDIPNATVMMIEGADRFGLSPAAPVPRPRGARRATRATACCSRDKPSDEARARLGAIESSQDGFAPGRGGPEAARSRRVLWHAPERPARPEGGQAGRRGHPGAGPRRGPEALRRRTRAWSSPRTSRCKQQVARFWQAKGEVS